MSLESLQKEKIYVLGPLEISPGQFAVGERSYAAIKGNMPRYNEIRQKSYLAGEKEVGDAIGELEARADASEAEAAKMTAAHKSAMTKLKATTEELEQLKKDFEKFKKVAADELKRAVIDAKRTMQAKMQAAAREAKQETKE